MVHRDIKPANLMITPGGTVKIMDFGIARMESMAGLTQSGVFMGTPRYISPEMARGAGADIRSDLYSLGLLAYEMLTGEPPFDAENPWAVLRQQIESEPAPIRQSRPDMPPWLVAIVFAGHGQGSRGSLPDAGRDAGCPATADAIPQPWRPDRAACSPAAATVPTAPVAQGGTAKGLFLAWPAAR